MANYLTSSASYFDATEESEGYLHTSADSGESVPYHTVDDAIGKPEVAWQQKFEQAMADVPMSMIEFNQHGLEVTTYASEVASSFIEEATKLATVILGEFDQEIKTIPPVSLGGVAGGEKYIANGILFKVSQDVEISPGRYLYGSVENAAKGSGHDLKAANCFFNKATELGHSEINGAMMCVVDYSGYRAVCMSILPLNPVVTFVLGSSDGGRSIQNKCPSHAGVRAVFDVCARLNLMPHSVANQLVPGPGDLEVHVVEGRAYVLDVARLMPPQKPPRHQGSAAYYQLFRAEFLQIYGEPMCSDVFTGWNKGPHRKEHNDRAAEATAFYYEKHIPIVASELQRKFLDPINQLGAILSHTRKRGINRRHLMLLHDCGGNSGDLRRAIISEIVARSIKIACRSRLRNRSRSIKSACFCFFDQLFSDENFWGEVTLNVSPDADELIDIPLCLTRCFASLGIAVSEAFSKRLMDRRELPFGIMRRKIKLLRADFVRVDPLVKPLNISSWLTGRALLLNSLLEDKQQTDVVPLLGASLASYNEAISMCPSNSSLFCERSMVYALYEVAVNWSIANVVRHACPYINYLQRCHADLDRALELGSKRGLCAYIQSFLMITSRTSSWFERTTALMQACANREDIPLPIRMTGISIMQAWLGDSYDIVTHRRIWAKMKDPQWCHAITSSSLFRWFVLKSFTEVAPAVVMDELIRESLVLSELHSGDDGTPFRREAGAALEYMSAEMPVELMKLLHASCQRVYDAPHPDVFWDVVFQDGGVEEQVKQYLVQSYYNQVDDIHYNDFVPSGVVLRPKRLHCRGDISKFIPVSSCLVELDVEGSGDSICELLKASKMLRKLKIKLKGELLSIPESVDLQLTHLELHGNTHSLYCATLESLTISSQSAPFPSITLPLLTHLSVIKIDTDSQFLPETVASLDLRRCMKLKPIDVLPSLNVLLLPNVEISQWSISHLKHLEFFTRKAPTFPESLGSLDSLIIHGVSSWSSDCVASILSHCPVLRHLHLLGRLEADSVTLIAEAARRNWASVTLTGDCVRARHLASLSGTRGLWIDGCDVTERSIIPLMPSLSILSVRHCIRVLYMPIAEAALNVQPALAVLSLATMRGNAMSVSKALCWRLETVLKSTKFLCNQEGLNASSYRATHEQLALLL